MKRVKNDKMLQEADKMTFFGLLKMQAESPRKSAPLFTFRREGDRHLNGSSQLTPQSLLKLAQDFAFYLGHELDVKQGSRVAIFGKPSPAWAVAFFGTSCLGAVPVLLDHQMTPEELRHAVDISEAKVLVVPRDKKEDLEKLESRNLKVVFLSEGADPFFGIDFRPVSWALSETGVKPDDLGAIFLSSGTTGPAKMVGLSHRNVILNAKAVGEKLGTRSKDCIVSIVPWHHSMGFNCTLILPMIFGVRVIYTDIYKLIAQFVKRYKANIVLAVPKFYKQFAQALKKNIEQKRLSRFLWRFNLTAKLLGWMTKRKALIPEFRFFASGSAPLDAEVVRLLARLGIGIVEGYGLTEHSPVVSFTDPKNPKPGHVGRPIPGVEVRVLRNPKERSGELLLKSPYVMAYGYLGDPERTAAAFDEHGWFKTGDLVVVDDGQIRILGRKDDVIILNTGQSLYPVEIESVLARSSLIAEAVVHQPVKDQPFIIAVYPDQDVLKSRKINPDDAATIRALLWREIRICQAGLASYKQIKKGDQLVIVSEPFPRTSTLDIRRRELAEIIEKAMVR